MFDRVVPDFEPTLEAQVLAGATLELLARRLERAMTAGVAPARLIRCTPRRWCGRRATAWSASS